MPNKSGYKATLSTGASIARLSRVGFSVDHAAVDVTDLSHVITQSARGQGTVDVTGEWGYKLQGGLKWSIGVGAYAGAEFNGGSLSVTFEEIETSDAADVVTQRVPGAATIELTADSGYNATTHFATLAKAAFSSATSLACTVTDATGSTIISGAAWVTKGGQEYPKGAAAAQSLGLRFKSATKLGSVNAKPLSQALTVITSKASCALTVKDPAATTKLSGAGFIMAAGMTWAKDGAVRGTLKASVHTITTLV